MRATDEVFEKANESKDNVFKAKLLIRDISMRIQSSNVFYTRVHWPEKEISRQRRILKKRALARHLTFLV